MSKINKQNHSPNIKFLTEKEIQGINKYAGTLKVKKLTDSEELHLLDKQIFTQIKHLNSLATRRKILYNKTLTNGK